jgi:hypothetical protein
MLGAEAGMVMQPIWHCTSILHSGLGDLPSCPDDGSDTDSDTDVMESQPGMDSAMALVESIVMLCMGHGPAEPLTASPVKGSTAQSHKTNNVRRIFTTGSIAQR